MSHGVAEASYLLRIIMFLRIAYGLGNVLKTSEAKPVLMPKTFPKPSGQKVVNVVVGL